jgi:hypothetical protein
VAYCFLWKYCNFRFPAAPYCSQFPGPAAPDLLHLICTAFSVRLLPPAACLKSAMGVSGYCGIAIVGVFPGWAVTTWIGTFRANSIFRLDRRA